MDFIVGADLALRHGAIVSAAGEIIHIFQSKDGMDSSLESIRVRAREAALSLPKYCTVVVDWDRDIASWDRKNTKGRIIQKNAKVGTLLTLMNWGFGLLARELRSAHVHFVAPSQIRASLGLRPQAPKSEVHKVTMHLRPQTLRGTKFHTDSDVRGDCIDGWLLAWLYPSTRLR